MVQDAARGDVDPIGDLGQGAGPVAAHGEHLERGVDDRRPAVNPSLRLARHLRHPPHPKRSFTCGTHHTALTRPWSTAGRDRRDDNAAPAPTGRPLGLAGVVAVGGLVAAGTGRLGRGPGRTGDRGGHRGCPPRPGGTRPAPGTTPGTTPTGPRTTSAMPPPRPASRRPPTPWWPTWRPPWRPTRTRKRRWPPARPRRPHRARRRVVHYLNRDLVGDGTVLDPARPDGLVYHTGGEQPVLLGAFFVAPRGTTAPSPAPDLVTWHTHDPACPAFFVTGAEPCTGSRRMLHVWTAGDVAPHLPPHRPHGRGPGGRPLRCPVHRLDRPRHLRGGTIRPDGGPDRRRRGG